MPRQYLGTTARNSSFGVLDIGSCQLIPHGGYSFCCIETGGRLRRGETGSGESVDLSGVLLLPLSLRLDILYRNLPWVGSSRTSDTEPPCDASEHPSAPLCRFSNLTLK